MGRRNTYYPRRPIFVTCRKCRKEFEEVEVEFLNIEEDFDGRDVLHFKCPACGKKTKSWRRG